MKKILSFLALLLLIFSLSATVSAMRPKLRACYRRATKRYKRNLRRCRRYKTKRFRKACRRSASRKYMKARKRCRRRYRR